MLSLEVEMYILILFLPIFFCVISCSIYANFIIKVHFITKRKGERERLASMEYEAPKPGWSPRPFDVDLISLHQSCQMPSPWAIMWTAEWSAARTPREENLDCTAYRLCYCLLSLVNQVLSVACESLWFWMFIEPNRHCSVLIMSWDPGKYFPLGPLGVLCFS